MNRLTSVLAFLIALLVTGTIVCGVCYFLLAPVANSFIYYPLADVLIPAPPPSSISTEASVPVTNSQLGVSFKQPEGWTLIESGRSPQGPFHLPYASYGLKGQPHAPILGISKDDSGFRVSQDDLDAIVRSDTSSWRWWGAHDIEGLYETVDGIPAGGTRYILGGKVGFHLFVSRPGLTHTFDWTSDVKYSHELEQIYRAMLPTIKFIPAPP